MPIQMFDDGQDKFVQSVQTFGEAVGGLLKQRLHKKQFEDFLAGPTKDFRDQMQQAQDILMDEANPEGPAQGMTMLKTALEQYMDEGARYSDNPIIQDRVQQTFKSNMDFLNMEFKQKFETAKNEREVAKSKRESEAHEVDMGLKRAQTKETLASAQEKSVKAGVEEAEAMGPQLFSGIPGSIDPMQEDPDRTRELWTRIENTIDQPGSEAKRKAVEFGMDDIQTKMAQQRLIEMTTRGEVRQPKKGELGAVAEPWDMYNPEHLEAVKGTIDRTEVRNRFILEKAKTEGGYHGIEPGLIDKEYGVIVDPTKAGAFRPLKNAVSSENLGKIMFGVAGWDQLRDPKTKARPTNLAEAEARLPATVAEANGPIAQIFKEFTLPEGVDPKSLKSADDVKALLSKRAGNLVKAIVGANANSNKLDEGMKNNRLEALKLVNAMIDKYGDEVYELVTGKKKQTANAGQTDAEAVQSNPMLGWAAKGAGAVKRGVLKPGWDKVTGVIKDFTED